MFFHCEMCFWHQNFPQFCEINILFIKKNLVTLNPQPLLRLILLVQGAEYFAWDKPIKLTWSMHDN